MSDFSKIGPICSTKGIIVLITIPPFVEQIWHHQASLPERSEWLKGLFMRCPINLTMNKIDPI